MRLELVHLIAVEYKDRFHDLSTHVTSILVTEYERVCCFYRGLRLFIRMSTQSLAIVGRFFVKVTDHA